MNAEQLMILKRFLIFSLLVLVSFAGQAQNDLLNSTLEQAKKYRNVGHFQEAVDVLEDFNAQYPGDLSVMSMLAETLFWMKKYDRADKVYRQAIELNPSAMGIKYAYAGFLFKMGRYEEAKYFLLVYTRHQPEDAGAQSLLGVTLYYLGDFKEAERRLDRSLELNPSDEYTRQVYREVSRLVGPWLKANAFYSDDSQPMSQLRPSLSGGWYTSRWLDLSLTAAWVNFSTDSIDSPFLDFKLQNTFNFVPAGLRVDASLGVFYGMDSADAQVTWGVGLRQNLSPNLQLFAGVERSPYTYTVASVYRPFLRTKYSAWLGWEKPKRWNWRLGYIGESFPDDNYVQTFYAWVLGPAISFSVFELYLGYAFNYADARESRYVTQEPLDQVMENYAPGESIPGIYDPYFTPEQQLAHSVLANLFVNPSGKVNLKLHASVGFYARAQNPYLFLERKNGGKTTLKRSFYKESFTPMDLGADFNADLSEHVVLNFSYNYLRTFYFDSHNFNLGLKIYF